MTKNSIKSKKGFQLQAERFTNNHTLVDWLSLHEISATEVSSILAQAQISTQVSSNVDIRNTHFDHSPEQAWNLALNALCAMFPKEADSIDAAQTVVETHFNSIEERCTHPYTLNRKPHKPPLVSLKYSGKPGDLICMAHEFAHAIQIQLTDQGFIPPVLRELAAFIGELALLKYMANTDKNIFRTLDSVWQRECRIYLISDVDCLYDSLCCGNTPYNYRWNYPIARLLATQLCKQLSAIELWDVFRGYHSLRKCIELATFPPISPITVIKNTLSPVPDDFTESLTTNNYRSLGIMALLDTADQQSPSKLKIGAYYNDSMQYIQDRTVYIALDKSNKPIGYFAWQDFHGDMDLTREVNLFGDYTNLRNNAMSASSEVTSFFKRRMHQG